MQKIAVVSLLVLSLDVMNASVANAFDSDGLLSQQGQADVTSLVPQVALASLSEGFEAVSNLTSSGWVFTNNSDPAPLSPAPWSQGVTTVSNFAAQSGPGNSFAQVGLESTSGDPITLDNGTISNWLITPELDFSAGGTFSFFVRTFGGNDRPELIEVRQSIAGASFDVGSTGTSLGDFTTLVGSAGDAINVTSGGGSGSTIKSGVWSRFSFNIAPTGGTGRLAFRYFATNGGVNGSQNAYSAIDTVDFAPVPEPVSSSFTGLAVLGLASYFKRKRTIS
jgi:hypothetical protein